ncbi:MAG: hypothetical protein ACLPXZ_14610 [Mycobacterium sp.]
MRLEDFNPYERPRFELDRTKLAVCNEVSVANLNGIVAFTVNDNVIVGDNAIPSRILFVADCGENLRLTMGIEVRGDAPVCTYLELAADNGVSAVQAKHLKPIRIEEWVTQIVVACANHVFTVKDGAFRGHRPDMTHERVKAIERMQRRRRDPRTDHALLERVATLYREHPDAPNKAVAAEFSVSERTAARWAGYCSDSGLLPQASKQGQKRL